MLVIKIHQLNRRPESKEILWMSLQTVNSWWLGTLNLHGDLV